MQEFVVFKILAKNANNVNQNKYLSNFDLLFPYLELKWLDKIGFDVYSL